MPQRVTLWLMSVIDQAHEPQRLIGLAYASDRTLESARRTKALKPSDSQEIMVFL